MNKNTFTILSAVGISLLSFSLLCGMPGCGTDTSSPSGSGVSALDEIGKSTSVSGDFASGGSALNEIAKDQPLPVCPNAKKYQELYRKREAVIPWREANPDTPENRAKAYRACMEYVDEYQKLADDCAKKKCPKTKEHLKTAGTNYEVEIALQRSEEVRIRAEAVLRK